MMKKRGQITLFVILGLLLLLIVGIGMYLISTSKVKDIPITQEQFKVSYDLNLEPIYQDITYCMKDLGTNAVKKMGTQGGFLNITGLRYNNPSEHRNNALQMFAGSDMIIPYWYYIDSPPDCVDCVQKLRIPTLEGTDDSSIQGQLKKYIEQNLLDCVNDFDAYKDDFDINYEKLDVTIFFREKDIYVGLQWPIEVKFKDGSKSSRLEFFNTEIDVPMKKIYEVALSSLLQLEFVQDTRTLESFTTDIIEYYSFGGKDALIPPTSGPTEFGLTAPKMWLLKDVKEILKEAISENIPFMQVQGSKDSYFYFSDIPLEQDLYSNYQNTIYTNPDYLANTKIRFNYFPTWPMYVNVNPSKGEVILPETVNMDLLFLQLGNTRYNFDYDIAYPVLLTFEDEYALDGKGYLFQYVYEVNLRNTAPYTNESINFSAIFDNEKFETQDTIEFGTPSQRTIPLKINVVNGYNYLPVENVSITYDCIDKTLFVGESKLKEGKALIETTMPPCFNGEFKHINEEYASNGIQKSLEIGGNYELNYVVYPKKNIRLIVKKRPYTPSKIIPESMENIDRNWGLTSGQAVTNIVPEEEVVFLMYKIKDGEETGDFEMLKLNYSNKTADISLVPGQYTLRVISTLRLGENYTNKNFVIPERKFTAGFDPLGAGNLIGTAKEVTIPEIEFNDSLLIGMLTLDESTIGYFNVSENQLLQKNNLIVYYAGYDYNQLQYAEDLAVLGEIQDSQNNYPDLFYPKFE